MSRSALVPIASLAVLVSLLALGGRAAEAGSATEALRATFTEANRILTDRTTAGRPLERLNAVRLLVSKAFDFSGAAEEALGHRWDLRDPGEKKEFTSLFASFVQRGFVYWLAAVAEVDDRSGRITVDYLGESADRDRTVVRTAIGRRGGRQVRLDHDMVYLGEGWRTRDVTIDGISLVTNYRAQFDRVIRTSSYPDLLARLRERVGKELPRPAAAQTKTPAEALAVPLVRPPPFEMR